MTLSEQCVVLIEAVEDELLQPEDIIRWADKIIVAMEKPPAWIIELSMSRSPHMVDYASRLREQASASPPVRLQIQVVVLAYDAGLLSLSATLSKLFRITMVERRGPSITDPLARRLVGALADWDQQDNLGVIDPSLQSKLKALFREYLTNTDDIAAILPWKFEKTA